MTQRAQQLLASVRRGGGFDLTALTQADFDVVFESADGPLATELFVWLCLHPQVEIARPRAIMVVDSTGDPGVMAEIVAWIARGADVPPQMRRDLWQAFLRRAEDRKSHYGTRSHALYGAMILAQDERSLLRRFQGAILDIDVGDDGRFLQHAAKIIGVLLAHEPDKDFRDLLESLTNVEEARDEAAMELGLDALRLGLDAPEHDEAFASFSMALSWFEKAVASSEERTDADLYRRCMEMLIAFQAEVDAGDIVLRVQGLRQAAFEYAAYLATSDRSSHTQSWLGSTDRERIHWSLLGMRLGALDLSLRKPAWLHAVSVIEEELLSVYTASQRIFRRSSVGGLEAVIRPRISGALQRERHYLDYLDLWISENAGSEWLPDADAMRREVAKARERSIARHPHDAALESPTVAAILKKGQVPLEHREGITARIAVNVLALTDETTSKVTEEIFASILEEMKKNADYAKYSDARCLFEVILYFTIRYVVSRHNLSTSSNPRCAFLFKRDPANLPLEKELQSDYLDFLLGSALADICHAEVRDRGGGRVDILFSFRGVTTVAELKRTEHNYEPERLIEEYGLQAVSYQTTNVTFGFLMVLDLFDRGGGQPHLREQVSVHHTVPSWCKTKYSVALFRIQGRRKTPSDL